MGAHSLCLFLRVCGRSRVAFAGGGWAGGGEGQNHGLFSFIGGNTAECRLMRKRRRALLLTIWMGERRNDPPGFFFLFLHLLHAPQQKEHGSALSLPPSPTPASPQASQREIESGMAGTEEGSWGRELGGGDREKETGIVTSLLTHFWALAFLPWRRRRRATFPNPRRRARNFGSGGSRGSGGRRCCCCYNNKPVLSDRPDVGECQKKCKGGGVVLGIHSFILVLRYFSVCCSLPRYRRKRRGLPYMMPQYFYPLLHAAGGGKYRPYVHSFFMYSEFDPLARTKLQKSLPARILGWY